VPSLAPARASTPGKIVVYQGVVLRPTNIQPLDSTEAKEGDRVLLKLTCRQAWMGWKAISGEEQ
jgi:hypothetical protein